MSSLCVKISKRGSEGFTGTVTIPGLQPTKLVRRDGTYVYGTRSGVVQSANALARRFKMDLTVDGEKSKTTSTSNTSSSQSEVY